MSGYAAIAVGRPVRGEFTYAIPDALEGTLLPGQRVLVPFGRADALGFYLGEAPEPLEANRAKVKPITRVLEEEPALAPDVIALLRFAAEYYRYPLGEAIRSALPPQLSKAAHEKAATPDVERFAQRLPVADPAALGRAPQQAAVLGYLEAVGGRASVEEVAAAIPGGKDALKRLAARGWVLLEAVERARTVREGLQSERPERLTDGQAAALEVLCAELTRDAFSPFLLQGVTGSGKTEVYLRVVEKALELGKGALVLVPEIALTPQLVGRFTTRFGPTVAVLHSGLKDRERLLHFQRLRRGEARIAVGVRSAVFAPVPKLGVIVVDEEHDGSFKQDEKLRYQARDLAVVRGKQCDALVILGSATPSLETLHNAGTGRYRKLLLPSRVDDRPMPQIGIVDLRTERPRFRDGGGEPPILAPASLTAIEETLARGQQAILFLNRRGHATFLLCQTCGESLRCDACDVSLTLHLSRRRLLCHYCGALREVPSCCPSCQGELIPLGVGTERVEAEVAEQFPRARVARLDRDVATSAEKLTDLLAAFARREIDVLVGTQMVAKGHDFPGVTLVCVVLADTSLSLPDFRAAERTFQLLTQVSGRAGRGKDAGRVLVQSYHPEAEPVRRVLDHDFDAFSAQELEWRRQLAYPPFSRMASVRIESADAALAEKTAKALASAAARRMPPSKAGVRLLGPAPAAIARIQGKSRFQLLLKAPTHGLLTGPLSALEDAAREAPRSVRVVVDVDPGAML